MLLGTLLSLWSCHRAGEEEPSGRLSSADACPINVYVADPEVKTMTKSSFAASELDCLTDLNVYMYHQGKLLREHSGYYDDLSDVMLSFPAGKDVFNIYMFGNVGPCEAPLDEAEICDLEYLVGSYDDFRTKGVPVAGAFKGFCRGDLAEFPLKRLVGRFDIRLRQSADDAAYLIKDVRIMNCALDVYPFSDCSKAEHFLHSYGYGEDSSGDMLTEMDIRNLNDGLPVSLCFVENLQGNLLPDNQDKTAKVPSSLPEGVADRCTYIEITADVTTRLAKYTDNKYRFYPGEDQTSDFSIRRNTLYEVVLDFKQNMVDEQEWRIEASDPDVVYVYMDKQEAMVVSGAEDLVLMRCLDNEKEFVDFDAVALNGYVNVEKKIVRRNNVDFVGFSLTSDVPLSGLYPPGSDPDYLTDVVRVTSKEMYNGKPLISKDIQVRVYYKMFPLFVSLERRTPSSSYSLTVRGRNPMGLGMKISSVYYCEGQSYVLDASAFNVEYGNVGNVVQLKNAVDLSPTYFGNMTIYVKYDNLSRLDLTITSVTDALIEDSGYRLSYPKLLVQAPLYTGDATVAFFGPGRDLSPMNASDIVENTICYFNYRLSGVNYMVGVDNESSAGLSVDYLMPVCVHDSEGGSYFTTGCSAHGANVTGLNRVSFSEEEADKYAAFPFYIVNATMSPSSTMLIPNGSIGNVNAKSNRGVIMEFLGPGRDLFQETRAQAYQKNRRHTLEYLVEVWKNQSGQLRTKQYSRTYVGGSYMTINGASSWLGGDTSDYGFTADQI